MFWKALVSSKRISRTEYIGSNVTHFLIFLSFSVKFRCICLNKILTSNLVACRGIESSTPGNVDGDISLLKVSDVDVVFLRPIDTWN